MAGVYSERFLLATGAGLVKTFVVPAGRRAVIRSVTAIATGGSTGEARLLVAQQSAWQHFFTGSDVTANAEFRHVAYPGEYVQTYTSAAGLNMIVSGYLLEDQGSELAAAPETDDLWLPVGQQLPARG